MNRDAIYKVLTIRYVMADRGRPGEYELSISVKQKETPGYDLLKEYIIWARERVIGMAMTDEQKSTLMILDTKVQSPVISVATYVYDMMRADAEVPTYDPETFNLKGEQT